MAFEDSILIQASPEVLFALTQDYGRRLSWDSFLKAADLVGGAPEAGLGVRALCVARSGLAMETEYVSFDAPRVAAVKMTRGPWFIDSFAGSWRFIAEAPDHTRVSFKYHVRGRPAAISGLLTRVFARDTRKRLEALKRAVEGA